MAIGLAKLWHTADEDASVFSDDPLEEAEMPHRRAGDPFLSLSGDLGSS